MNEKWVLVQKGLIVLTAKYPAALQGLLRRPWMNSFFSWK
jgi:hypothetical protein